jgi:lipopolysaccharide export LptBFGC system permease protein LptF
MRRMLAPFFIALFGLCAAVVALQLLRLGHHLVGAGLGVIGLLGVIAASLPTVVAYVLPIALVFGVLAPCARLSNELFAARAMGASPRQLALWPAFLVGLAAIAVALVAAVVEPATRTVLYHSLHRHAVAAVVRGAPARRFHALGPHATFYAETVTPKARHVTATGVFLAISQTKTKREQLLFAPLVRLRPKELGLSVTLKDGTLLSPPAAHDKNAPLFSMRFSSLQLDIDLSTSIDRHFGFLAPSQKKAGRARDLLSTRTPLQRAASTLLLGLFALASVLLASTPRRGLSIALALCITIAVADALLAARLAAGIAVSASLISSAACAGVLLVRGK